MPLFEIKEANLQTIEKTNFSLEKELQRLVEKNLEVIFNCRFVFSEFSTGQQHAGRIDTLALSEENNPVIIEYKKVESSELINQALFYLNWIYDHKGDFEIAAQKTLGRDSKVDWSDVRVICIAPNYRKYDLHAVQVIGANIELWSYRLFENSTLYLEEVRKPGESSKKKTNKIEPPKEIEEHTLEEHLEGKPQKMIELIRSIQDYVSELDPDIKESYKKHYIVYKTSQNIFCVEPQRQKLVLTLKLDPKQFKELPKNFKDVTNVGHWGTGDMQIHVKNEQDIETAKPYIEAAYKKVGS